MFKSLRNAVLLLCGLNLGACAMPFQNATADSIEAAPMTPPQRWCERLPRPEFASVERIAIAQDWFEVYRVGEQVYAIYEPFQFQEVISYLILGRDSALLFDTGMGIGRLDEVVRQITPLQVRVLNSHSHLDHIGGNADFDFVYAMSTDFTIDRAQGMAHDLVADEVAPGSLCRGLPDGVSAADYAIRPFDISATIVDGTRIHLGERTLEVLHVPGHTPDAVALLDEQNGYLWTGDSFYAGPIWLFAPETDLAVYATSVNRMAALVPKLTALFPAHNTPRAQPASLTRLDEVVQAVQNGRLEPLRVEGEMVEYPGDGFSLIVRRER
ncbi:MAG: MBL fold metallo-hydrolase [Gammaproteobacteria bacterium]